MRLFACSDLHVESAENRAWLQQLSPTAFRRDALIVAGDVSDEMHLVEAALRCLVEKFGTVFFTPGNHDLWLSAHDTAAGVRDSLTKLTKLLTMCSELGVVTGELRVGNANAGVNVCPILSFHHQSWDDEPDIEDWAIPPADLVMSDYHNCNFPPSLSMKDESVARAVDALNDGRVPAAESSASSEPRVTFSHFLPRVERLPEKRFLTLPVLAKASGSRFLRDRVQALRPIMHVFGHSHFGWDQTLDDGVRYVQAALGYPGERRSRWHTLRIGEFGSAGPLLLWSAHGGFVDHMPCRWSGYYEHHPREPHRVSELASYAAPQFRKTGPRAVVVMPDFSHEGPGAAAGLRMLTSDPALR